MAFVTVGQENSTDIHLYYEDHGSGDPLVLIHGYPFSGDAWEKQTAFFLDEGFRVITYDRRGFGRSSRPAKGYDYDTFASDLDHLLNELDLQDVVLVGHSMGTGEVTRYIAQYGATRVKAGVLVSPIPPFLLKTEDNPQGVPAEVFKGITDAIDKDRYAYMSEFLKNFYNLASSGHGVSEEKLRADFTLGVSSSPVAFRRCVDTWVTDFRPDLKRIRVPLLVIQGEKDQILPIDVTGKRIEKARLHVIAGGSHGIPWTHAEEVSTAIQEFIQGLEQRIEPPAAPPIH